MKRKAIEAVQRRDSEAGYTLLEVIIALSIFMIGILAIGTMQTSALRGNSTSTGFTQAVNQGQAWVEQLMAEPFDPSSPSDILDPADNGTAAHQRTYQSGRQQYTIEWETTAVDLPGGSNPDALDVELSVQWADLYGQHSVDFQFLKTTRF